MKTCGILALQGDFEAHAQAVQRAGGHAVQVRTPLELAACHGLIIPGGESTTMLKLLAFEGLTAPLLAFAADKPVYGTCAGAILLAKQVTHPAQASLGVLDISVERNAYGRQIDSRISRVTVKDQSEMEAVFIRAPIIRSTGPAVTILAWYQGDPVWIEQGSHMATTFHPELTADIRVHQRFLSRL